MKLKTLIFDKLTILILVGILTHQCIFNNYININFVNNKIIKAVSIELDWTFGNGRRSQSKIISGFSYRTDKKGDRLSELIRT